MTRGRHHAGVRHISHSSDFGSCTMFSLFKLDSHCVMRVDSEVHAMMGLVKVPVVSTSTTTRTYTR
jgi:hypothetical protein